ncbi:hypothetical protein HOI83_01295 [Candidatus Uhrbacteria bacterium]|jgi:hypothetical protein|nr:hypothetical protein [Candidatus Uhrbacteria bacterium]
MKRRKYRSKQRRANPYFRTTEKQRISRSFVLFVITILGMVGVLSIFIYAPFVRLDLGGVEGGSVEVNEAIAERVAEELTSYSLFIFPKNHIWFFSDDAMRKALIDHFPLNAATVARSSGLVDISVAEKVSTFYLVKDDTMFAVDRSGVVIDTVEDLDRARIEIEYEAGKGAPLIYDKRSASVGEGETVLSAERLENIVRLFDQVQAKTMLTPLNANLSDEEGRVDIETDSGVSLYFTLNRPVESQVDKLESLIDRKLVQITELSYIDLRFTNRLFYH